MIDHPVHCGVNHPVRYNRLQLLLRLIVFSLLGWLGVTFAAVFGLLYVALPVVASVRLAGSGSAGRYTRVDGPRLVRGLHWFTSASAWLGLGTDELPTADPAETTDLRIEPATQNDSAAALLRVLTGLPSALVFALLAAIGVLVWIWAAFGVLLFGRVGDGAHGYLVGLQRWSVRLLAYQASLVDAYPPFSFEDAESKLTAAHAAR